MAQRRFHYEQAFEHYLRVNRVPYVAVDEAKKSLMPQVVSSGSCDGEDGAASIKSFDFVVYAPGRGRNVLVDVKGRMFGSANAASSLSNRRLESWVTMDDITGLTHWQEIFGGQFEAVFVFAYCLRQQPPDALFEELFAFGRHWYALREVTLEAYRREMITRSRKWDTVHIPREAFARISRPFSVRNGGANAEPPQPACEHAHAGRDTDRLSCSVRNVVVC